MKINISIVICLMILLLIRCKTKVSNEYDEKVERAKWFFYCYSNDLNIYPNNDSTYVSSLKLNVKLSNIKIDNYGNKKYFFKYYFDNDTTNFYSTKPLEILGVIELDDSTYVPFYNHIEFDSLKVYSYIKPFSIKKKAKFNLAISNNSDSICEWLKENYGKYKTN